MINYIQSNGDGYKAKENKFSLTELILQKC